MSFEAIKSIKEAEEKARTAKLQAQEKAKEAKEEAERHGKQMVADATARAEAEITQLRRITDARAAESAKELASTTANRQAALSARAEGRLDRAAQLIVERIVSA